MNLCQKLDDYLDRDLTKDAERAFVDHLAECGSCREIVDAHRRIGQTLTQAICNLEPVPQTLAVTTVGRRKSVARIGHVGTVAATFVAALLALTWLNRPGTQPGPGDKVIVQAVEPPVRVTMSAGANLTAVAVPSEHPNVAVFFLFPTQEKRGHQ